MTIRQLTREETFLQLGIAFAAGVPQRQHFYRLFSREAVVKVIVDASQVHASHAFEVGIPGLRPDSRM
jgi:hypothetical protein